MKVLTDARVEKVLDAAYDSVADGNYAEGALGAIDSIENYLEMGVPAGRYTQVREEKKHSLEWYEVLFAAVAAAIVAALPCFSVMRQYKMQKEHRQSLGFHMAYRADSALHFVQNEEQFVNRSVVTRRIPKNPGPGASGRFGWKDDHTSGQQRKDARRWRQKVLIDTISCGRRMNDI